MPKSDWGVCAHGFSPQELALNCAGGGGREGSTSISATGAKLSSLVLQCNPA